jgi:hypothetical protein
MTTRASNHDLTGPGYEPDSKTRILLESKVEMKERGADSPNDADALALTFARNIAVRPKPEYDPRNRVPRGD